MAAAAKTWSVEVAVTKFSVTPIFFHWFWIASWSGVGLAADREVDREAVREAGVGQQLLGLVRVVGVLRVQRSSKPVALGGNSCAVAWTPGAGP